MGLMDLIKSDTVQSNAAALAGKTQKAVLCIQRISRSYDADGNLNPVSLKDAQGNALPATSVNKALSKVKDVVNAGMEQKWWENNNEIKAALDDDFHVMQVQYNPKSISFNSYAGNYAYTTGAGEGGYAKMHTVPVPAQMRMRVELIFDDVNINDAFSDLYLRAKVKDLATQKTHSVQTQVEGLISLMTQVATRQVLFHWADMTFVGELQSVNARYTMFSPAGRPIRASVTLTLLDKTADSDADRHAMDDYWEKAFDKLFGEAGVNTLVSAEESSISKEIKNQLAEELGL